MFRISQYMQELSAPDQPGPKHNPPAPVVIWNLIRRCNLTCKHCYSISTDRDFPGELTTEEVFAVMDDLKRFRVPVLILSGGEPLLRPDIFDIARRAKSMGFYVGLSSNGTLIDAANIDRIAECDFDYVGVSLDGIGATHDKFRQMSGAFEASLHGIRLCRDLGLKIGVRFTMTQDNAHDLPRLLELVEDEGIDRFYFSHLNYAGRGNKNRKDDAQHQLTRWAMDLLFDTCWEYQQRGLRKEFTTGNNDADGVYFLHWVSAALPGQGGEHSRPAAPVGGQLIGGQRRQHRQSRQRASRHHVVALHLGNVRQRPSRRSGRTSPTRCWPASSSSRAVSGAAANASTSTSATATRACAPSN
jgi:MoaA/NifB/PqqE/SkfB family radical SAM enzyme